MTLAHYTSLPMPYLCRASCAVSQKMHASSTYAARHPTPQGGANGGVSSPVSPGSGRDRQAPQGTGRLEAYMHMHHPAPIVPKHRTKQQGQAQDRLAEGQSQAVVCALSRLLRSRSQQGLGLTSCEVRARRRGGHWPDHDIIAPTPYGYIHHAGIMQQGRGIAKMQGRCK